MMKLDSCLGRLTVALQQPFGRQEEVRVILEQVRDANHDHHLLFSQVGESLNLIPEDTVKLAFLSRWTEEYADECDRFLAKIIPMIPAMPT